MRAIRFSITVALLITLAYALVSCSRYPCGSPAQVQKWERKTKMRAHIKKLNTDSCFVARKMAMARKY